MSDLTSKKLDMQPKQKGVSLDYELQWQKRHVTSRIDNLYL